MKHKINDNSIEIYENDKLISYAIIDENILTKLYVNPKYRNISYGRTTLTLAIEEIKKRGFNEVLVYDFDMASYNFFKKQGFKIQNNSLIYVGLDEERTKEKTILNTSIFSFFLNIFLAITKLFIGFSFGLASITADGINALSDSISNLLVILGLKISNMPEDNSHPFGHGKIESIFSLLIGTIIVYSSFSVLVDTVKMIFSSKEALNLGKNNNLIIFFSSMFILIKISQYLYVRYVANKHNNTLLKAIIKDYLADILVSFSVLIGIVLSLHYSKLFDVILGLILSLYIMYQGICIIYENSLNLMDTQDFDLLNEVKEILLKDEHIFLVHDLFMLSTNKNIYIFADIRVDKDLSVEKSHEIAEKASLNVRKKISKIKRVTLHVEPIY